MDFINSTSILAAHLLNRQSEKNIYAAKVVQIRRSNRNNFPYSVIKTYNVTPQ